MILALFQAGNQGGGTGEEIYTFIIFSFLIALVLFKIGLKVTKAPERTSIKWVLISFGIQIGIFFFLASPLILIGMTENQTPPFVLIIIFIILALFLDVHVLNIIHKLGIKRAVLCFMFIVVPFLLVAIALIVVVTSGGNA